METIDQVHKVKLKIVTLRMFLNATTSIVIKSDDEILLNFLDSLNFYHSWLIPVVSD